MKQEALSIAMELAQLDDDLAERAAEIIRQLVNVAYPEKTKQDEIQKSVSSRLEVNMKLEQDEMEGVDEKEWDE